jgi:hypothetical protein
MADDPLALKADADLAIDRAARQLDVLLKEAARRLRPFPPFPGAFFTNAVEVDLTGVERSDIGCIVVTEEGELRELALTINATDEFGDIVDMVQSRDEELKELEDLHPRDFIVLAYNAIGQLTELLLEREASREGA